jgi:hypothetical protein
MGKKHRSKVDNPNPRGIQNPKPTSTSTLTSTSTTTTTSKSGMAGNSNFPKATPQAQTGTMPKAKTATYPLTQKPQFLKPANPAPLNQPQNHTGRPFVIPKGEDKRARDPSQNSKSSGRSAIPPPAKQQRSYAEAVKPFHTQHSIGVHWPEFQLRVYSASKHNEHISNNAFHELKNMIARHTLDFLRTNPGQSRQTHTNGIFYNKVLKCGIVNCVSKEALDWYRGAIELVSNNFFRGWGKEEQVTTGKESILIK